jgi:HSP20 family protein
MMKRVWWRSVSALGPRSNIEPLFQLEPRWRRLFWPIERLISFSPDVEVVEQDDAHVLVVDLPGIPKEDIDIRVDDQHILTISGERRERRRRHSHGRSYSERRYGTFSRSIELPRSVDPSRMEVAIHDGVLEIHLPKLEVSRGRNVQIGNRDLVSRDGGRTAHASS